MGYRAVGTNIAGKLKTNRTARIGVLILIGGAAGPHHGGSIPTPHGARGSRDRR